MSETKMVYYHPKTNTILIDSYLDAHFFGLVSGIKWKDIEILGEL